MKPKPWQSHTNKLVWKELLGDWLFISGYLIALFLLAMGFYNLVLGDIPTFTESQSQLLAFYLCPASNCYLCLARLSKGSFGKHWADLQLVYKHRSFAHTLCALLSSFSLGSWDIWGLSVVLIKQMLCQFSCQLQQGFSSWSFCWWDCSLGQTPSSWFACWNTSSDQKFKTALVLWLGLFDLLYSLVFPNSAG